MARDGRRDGVFGGARSVWHSDGCVFIIVIGAVEVVVGVEVRFIVDDVANAAGYGPVIVSKVHYRCASTGDQFDVVRRSVGLIKNVRDVRL